jgi:hypothetical protein
MHHRARHSRATLVGAASQRIEMSGTLPNARNTVASPKLPKFGSPVRSERTNGPLRYPDAFISSLDCSSVPRRGVSVCSRWIAAMTSRPRTFAVVRVGRVSRLKKINPRSRKA